MLGFKLVIYPNWMVLAAIRAASDVLRRLKAPGSVADLVGEVTSFKEFFDLLGMPEVQALEARNGVKEHGRAGY